MQTAFLGFLVGLMIMLLTGGKAISLLKKYQQHGQPIRADGPATHMVKASTPTMGGLIIGAVILVASMLFCDLTSSTIQVILIAFYTYGAIGFLDDYAKVTKKNTKGLTVKMRFLVEFIIAFCIVFFIHNNINPTTLLNIPFVSNCTVDIGPFYYILAATTIVGSANAVNLTDGLDGLASGSIIMVMSCFLISAYMVLQHMFPDERYGIIINAQDNLQLMIFCAITIGVCLGFLWYNAYPAMVFMGDVGSLAIGASIGTIAIMMRQELMLVIIGGIFVVEALSVIIQVFSYKTRKKRVFLMAPIHHHFEKLGWKETKVVARFWIINFLLCVIGVYFAV